LPGRPGLLFFPSWSSTRSRNHRLVMFFPGISTQKIRDHLGDV
jgi:hypothetical protein